MPIAQGTHSTQVKIRERRGVIGILGNAYKAPFSLRIQAYGICEAVNCIPLSKAKAIERFLRETEPTSLNKILELNSITVSLHAWTAAVLDINTTSIENKTILTSAKVIGFSGSKVSQVTKQALTKLERKRHLKHLITAGYNIVIALTPTLSFQLHSKDEYRQEQFWIKVPVHAAYSKYSGLKYCEIRTTEISRELTALVGEFITRTVAELLNNGGLRNTDNGDRA